MAQEKGRVARARGILLVAGVLVVATVAGYLGLNRLKRLGKMGNLPHRLGVNITSEGDNISYSQSAGGNTLFTLHAAKSIEYSDGTARLHHVSIELYGRKQDRTDRISGEEFEYNKSAGEIRAIGEVHIDLQAPASTAKPLSAAAAADVIHVKTNGLVYLQKLGLAATKEDVEFEFHGMAGRAHGAEYSSDTGVVVLEHAVEVDGEQQQRPFRLTADRAELERQSDQVLLDGPRYVSAVRGAAAREASAGKAVLHLRADGTVERLDAAAGVALASGTVRMNGQQAAVLLNADNQATHAKLTGGVQLADKAPAHEVQGSAAEANVEFDQNGLAHHVTMSQAVHLHEIDGALQPGGPQDERELWGNEVQVALKTVEGKHTTIDTADATGGARVLLVRAGERKGAAQPATLGSGPGRTAIAADALHAGFVQVGGAQSRLDAVRGSGHTRLDQTSDSGARQTSTGDTLLMHFRTAAEPAGLPVAVRGPSGAVRGSSGARTAGSPGTKPKAAPGALSLADAVQQGHVVMTQRPAQQPGQPSVQDSVAHADRAAWDGGNTRLVLTGAVDLLSPATNGTTTLAAPRVTLEQSSGDALAEGGVKATFVEQRSASASSANPPAEPVHVLADHAELHHDAQHAIFYAAAGAVARLWQGGSQVEAPVLDYDEQRQLLVARADRGFDLPNVAPVHAYLVSTSGNAPSPGPGGPKRSGAANVVNVASRQMVYSDQQHQVEFTGGVVVHDADGVMTAQQATVFLANVDAAGPAAGKANTGLFGGSVDHMIARGGVVVTQPGRRAEGDQVVYTAADSLFVMTGTPALPPRVIDEMQGTLAGTTVRFDTKDNSVVVSGTPATGQPGEKRQRVRTVTKVKPQQ